MADMEWNDLAAQSLPSLSAGGDLGSSAATWKVHRNLSELQHAANQSVWAAPTTNGTGGGGGGGGGISQPPPSSWQSMASLQQSVRSQANAASNMSMNGTGNDISPVPAAAESLQDMLARHEQGILNRIILQTEAETRKRTDQLVEQQLQQAWEKERDCWIQELVGTRTLGGAAMTTSGSGMAPLQSSSSNMLTARPHSSETQMWASPSPHNSNHNNSSLVEVRSEPSGPVDPQVVQAHLAVVKEELKGELTAKQLEHVVEKFQKLTDPSSGSPMESSYASSWQLIGQLTKVHTHSPVDQAMAALAHFCQQFQMIVVNRVRRGALAHQDMSVPTMYVNDMAGQCAAFVKLTLGVTDSPWPVLFYCLRCGDAVAAKEVLSKSVVGLTGDAEAALHRIVAAMAQGQRNACCFWEAGPPRVDTHDRRVVADLLERSKNLESPDLHRTGVYALLCGTASYPTSETIIGFNTIEDYLCSSLWKALLHPNPVDELVRLAQVLVDQYGPSYFHDPKSCGWSYALPLLATQQYQKALSHLADAGGATGILQATHLGLVLVSAGVPVRNLGQPEGPDNVVAALLVAYSNKLLSDPAAGSLAALEYIARIPNKTQARRETAALIAKTGETEKLVGRLNAQGIRENDGALEKHFRPAEITALLGEAADILSSREKGDRQKIGSAAMCFMLAGRYADVLSLLNQLLSPPNEPNEDRQFWLEQTQAFHSHYLAKRTHVSEVLERDGQRDLVKTSRTMMDLNAFFARLRAEQFQEALSIAESLQLLPASQNDVASKETEYQGLNALVKQAYPYFLVGAMETLYSEHRRIKLDLQAGASPVVRERLLELQEKARILVTFAGLVGMGREQTESLSRLESLMI
jgi:hypothetical protein